MFMHATSYFFLFCVDLTEASALLLHLVLPVNHPHWLVASIYVNQLLQSLPQVGDILFSLCGGSNHLLVANTYVDHFIASHSLLIVGNC